MSSQTIKILLVEDNPGYARYLQDSLTEADSVGIECVNVRLLGDARGRLRDDAYDAVLLDLGLPDSHGLQTLELLRSESPAVPIIVLTGLEDEALALEALHHGAQDYLAKGQTDGDLLIHALRYAIERKHVEEALRLAEHSARRLADENAVLAEIGKVVSSSLELDEVFDSFGREVRRLVPFDVLLLTLLDPENGSVEATHLAGDAEDEEAAAYPLTMDVVASRIRPIADSEAQGNCDPAYSGSVMSAPLLAGDRVLGTLTLKSRAPIAYADEHLALLERVASQIVGRVASSRLVDRFRKSSQTGKTFAC